MSEWRIGSRRTEVVSGSSSTCSRASTLSVAGNDNMFDTDGVDGILKD